MGNKYLVGILATHPIQYYVPWYQALAEHPEIDLKVFYCHRQTPEGQARAGFGVEFDWNIPLLEGYEYQFLNNRARYPDVYTFFGCDTPQIRQIIYKNSFDAFIVHGWYVKSFWQAMIACWKNNTPVLIRGDSYLLTNRLFIKRWLKHGIYRTFIPKFDAYLAVGKRSEEYYLYYGAERRKMYFVPHAVDNNFFASRCNNFLPQRENLRKNWKIPKEAIVFLFAGKLIPRKRPYDFIKAVRFAYRDCPNIFGLIVGNGPLRSGLESTVQKYNLPITFTDFLNQKEISKAYAASDILVLPSDIGETWGLVVNETMACGLPAVVSNRVGCAPDLIRAGETGEEFECGDVKQLSEIFIDLASKPERLKRMGEKAREIIKDYSIDKAVEGTIEAIRFVVDNNQWQIL